METWHLEPHEAPPVSPRRPGAQTRGFKGPSTHSCPLPGFAIAAPVKMRIGCGPVGIARVCYRLATQSGCTGWKGRCGGSGPRGLSASFFLSFVLPVFLPSSSSLSAVVGTHRIPNCVPASRWVANPNICCKAIFSIPSSPPHWFGNRAFVRRHLVVVSGGGRGWGRRSRFFFLLCCAAIWTLRCDFTLAFVLFCGFPHQCWWEVVAVSH